jgi:hypothetical protein
MCYNYRQVVANDGSCKLSSKLIGVELPYIVCVSFHKRSIGVMTDSSAHGAFHIVFTKTGTLIFPFCFMIY